MTICTLIKWLCCFIDVLDTTFKKVNCIIRLEVDVVKHGIFSTIDLAVELLCVIFMFLFSSRAASISTPFALHNHWFACGYFSSNQDACKQIGFSEGHNRCFWEDFILILV